MQDEYTIWNLTIDPLIGGRVQIFGKTIKNQNSMQKEIRSRLKSEHVCYHSVQNPWSPRDLSPVWDFVAHIEGGIWVRVFGNMVLWRIFGPERDRVGTEWRKLNIEELSDLVLLPNNLRVIKSRIRWVWHVERMGGGERDRNIQGVTGGTDQTSGGCSLC